MYEIGWIISSGAKMGISSEKYAGRERLLWDLNLLYSEGQTG
jgi:hypothetical protein